MWLHVHEAAHVFHNCKRRAAGLPETRMQKYPVCYPEVTPFSFSTDSGRIPEPMTVARESDRSYSLE
jgi:hypothetical protein